MNKKTIIQIVVIVVAFGGAGMVLYNGFGKKTTSSSSDEAVYLSASKSQEKVLPYGETFNLKQVLTKRPFQFAGDVTEKLNPNSEVGIPESSIIISRPSATSGK